MRSEHKNSITFRCLTTLSTAKINEREEKVVEQHN